MALLLKKSAAAPPPEAPAPTGRIVIEYAGTPTVDLGVRARSFSHDLGAAGMRVTRITVDGSDVPV